MREIKTVAMLGAGAIGAYFIEAFAKLADIDFCLVAKGERKERLSRDGLVINDAACHVPVKTPTEAKGADLLLLSTKYDGLFDALPDIKEIVTDETIVVSLLNGIDSEEILEKALSRGHIPYALMRISAERKGNVIRFDTAKTPGLFIGEKGRTAESDELLAIRALMEKTPLKYNFVPDIIADQWTKFSSNLAYNLPQALLNVPYAAYFDSAHVGFLRDRLEEEVGRVAAAYGIHPAPLVNRRETWGEKARFSTLQDLDDKRHTEIEMFAGVLMQKAADVRVPVPYTEYTYHAIKALEEKNDGLFDYA